MQAVSEISKGKDSELMLDYLLSLPRSHPDLSPLAVCFLLSYELVGSQRAGRPETMCTHEKAGNVSLPPEDDSSQHG